MDEDRGLKLVLETQLTGLEALKEGEKVADALAKAEDRATQAFKRSLGPYQDMIKASRELHDTRKALGGLAMPPRIDEMIKASQSPRARAMSDFQKDVERQQGHISSYVNRAFGGKGGGGTLADMVKQFRGGGGGGLNGLLGEAGGMEGLAGLGKLAGAAGPVGAVITLGTAAYEAGKKIFELSEQSARATQFISDLRTQTGGSTLDASRAATLSRVTGIEAGTASRAFNDRITSDPQAMAFASRLGISNTPGLYGKRDFGKQYEKAIEALSNIADPDSRDRSAQALGLEQEVSRYSKLSKETRDRMDRFSRTNARINNPEAERRAAELMAAVENEHQARENMTTALGDLAGRSLPITRFLNTFAEGENNIAEVLNGTNRLFGPGGSMSPDRQLSQNPQIARMEQMHRDIERRTSPHGGSGGGPDWGGFWNGTISLTKPGGPSEDTTPTAKATQADASVMLLGRLINALERVSGNLEKFSGTYGGGDRAGSAIPSGLRENPVGLSQAVHSRGLHLAGLG